MQKQQEAEQRRKAEMEQRQQQWVFIQLFKNFEWLV